MFGKLYLVPAVLLMAISAGVPASAGEQIDEQEQARLKQAYAQKVETVRTELTGSRFEQGIQNLKEIKQQGEDFAEYAEEIGFLSELSGAHVLGREGDVSGSIAAFRETLTNCNGKPQRVKDVLNAVVAQAGRKAQAKAFISTDKYIEFVRSEFPQRVGHFEAHINVSALINRQARHYPGAKELLTAAAHARTDQEWQRVVHNMSPLHWMKSWEQALEIFECLETLANGPEAKRGIALSKAAWLIQRGKVDEGRDLAEKHVTDEQRLGWQFTRLWYSMAKAYLIANRMQDAHDAFMKAELAADAMNYPPERDTIFGRVFYGDFGRQRTFRLDELLAAVLRDTQDGKDRERFISLYCKAAGKTAKPGDAVAFLDEIQADGKTYIALARWYAQDGNVKAARTVLASIPAGVAREVSQQVENFWQ